MSYLKNDAMQLRAPEPEDLDRFYIWENDTELWQYGAALSPISRYALKAYLAELTHDIYQTGQLRFVIECLQDKSVAGTIDLYDFDPHHRRAGIGILVDAAFRRRGVATKALELLLAYAFGFLRLHQVYAHIPVSNIASLSLFEKNGFRNAGILKEWISRDTTFDDVCIMQYVNQLK